MSRTFSKSLKVGTELALKVTCGLVGESLDTAESSGIEPKKTALAVNKASSELLTTESREGKMAGVF